MTGFNFLPEDLRQPRQSSTRRIRWVGCLCIFGLLLMLAFYYQYRLLIEYRAMESQMQPRVRQVRQLRYRLDTLGNEQRVLQHEEALLHRASQPGEYVTRLIEYLAQYPVSQVRIDELTWGVGNELLVSGTASSTDEIARYAKWVRTAPGIPAVELGKVIRPSNLPSNTPPDQTNYVFTLSCGGDTR